MLHVVDDEYVWQLEIFVVTALHNPLERKYPVLHTEQAVADVHVLQLLIQARHVPELKKYPDAQDVQVAPVPDLIQLTQFAILHNEHKFDVLR